MKCTACGTEFDGNFCPNCGTRAASEIPVAKSAPATGEIPTEPTTNPNLATPVTPTPPIVTDIPVTSTPPTVNATPAIPDVSQKIKKPFYKKWWFWVSVVVLILVVISAAGGGEEDSLANAGAGNAITQSSEPDDPAADIADKNKVTVIDFSAMSKTDIEAWAQSNKVTCTFSEEYSDTVASGSVISQSNAANDTVREGATIKIVISKGKKPSIEYQNALSKAESYSEIMHMSKKAIYDQLTSEYGEKFPADAAQYAIDNLDTDYKANALEKAKSYQKTMHMSKSAIYDQLVSEYGEQFTAEEAQYAIDHLDD